MGASDSQLLTCWYRTARMAGVCCVWALDSMSVACNQASAPSWSLGCSIPRSVMWPGCQTPFLFCCTQDGVD